MVRRITYSILAGVGLTFLLAALALAAASQEMYGLAGALFWQEHVLTLPFGPRPNMGTVAHPMYEGTPVDIVAMYASFPVGIIIYGAIAYLLMGRYKKAPNQSTDPAA